MSFPLRQSTHWCLAGVACLAASANAQSGMDWVRKVRSAEKSTAYVGTMRAVTLLEDGKHESHLQVWAGGRGRFRREYGSGPAKGLIVIATPEVVWRREPGSTSWLKLPGRDGQAPDDARLLARNYEAEVLRTEEVAGLRCHVIDLRAKHPGNPRKTLWIESKTGLPLRTDQYNSDGKLISKSYFLEVTLKPVTDDSLFRAPANAKTQSTPLADNLRPLPSLAEVERVCGHRPHQPATVPPGYVRDGYFARQCRKNDVTLPAIRYFDGLNSIMVFERIGEGKGERGRGWGLGRGRGWGRGRGRGQGQGWQRYGGRDDCQFQETPQQKVIRFDAGARSYLIVGDHDRDALVRMAESFR